MRIGLIPDGFSDWLKLRSRQFPQPVADVMGTMIVGRTVMAGVHFRVFDRLAAGPRTAPELARQAGCDPHGMKLLLDALVACGYLEQKDALYRNARLGKQWLRSDAPKTLANFVLFNYDQWNWVSHLEEFIQHGSARNIHEQLDEQGWRHYMFGLRDLARLSTDELVAKVRFPQRPRSLLDVGGGHGQYAVALCRRYPSLRATVVDLEPAARLGREVVQQEGLSDRVEFRSGHLLETPFGRNHNVAFYFNVAHHLDEPTNRSVFQRLHAALAPGGRAVVWEPFQEEQERRGRDQLGKLLGLFFGVTSKEQTYSFGQVAGWAREVGFQNIRRQELRTAPFAALLVAEKEMSDR